MTPVKFMFGIVLIGDTCQFFNQLHLVHCTTYTVISWHYKYEQNLLYILNHLKPAYSRVQNYSQVALKLHKCLKNYKDR